MWELRPSLASSSNRQVGARTKGTLCKITDSAAITIWSPEIGIPRNTVWPFFGYNFFVQQFNAGTSLIYSNKCPCQSHFQFDHNQTPPHVSKSNLNPLEQLSAGRHVYWHPTLSLFLEFGARRPPNPNCIGFWPLLDHISPSSPPLLLFSFCNAVSLSITPRALSARCKLFAAECKSSPRSATANIA